MGDRGVPQGAGGRQGAGLLKGWWERGCALPPPAGAPLVGRLAALPCCFAAHTLTAREGAARDRHCQSARGAGRRRWRQQRQPSSVCRFSHQLAACSIHAP